MPVEPHSVPGPIPVPTDERFTFGGTGSEYFRIWVVNILLTVLTLGIYSAWAKVRRMQYFYRNTRLAGAGFDYHAEPLAILKGRIIAAMLFGAITPRGAVSPWPCCGHRHPGDRAAVAHLPRPAVPVL